MLKLKKNVNLEVHLPLFIQVYKEIHFLMEAENPEFQMVFDESERIKNNQFITTCDLVGIERFEKLLKIAPSDNDNLQSRISRVMMCWNDVVPYTLKTFMHKLDTLCGVGNYEIIPNFKEYMMKVITHLDLYGQVDDLENILGHIMPANLQLDVKNELHYDLFADIFVHTGLCVCELYELTDSYKVSFTIDGDAHVAGTNAGYCEVEITDSYNDTINIANNAVIGSNVSITNIIQV